VVILRDAPIAHVVESEDALQDAERRFHFRSSRDLLVFFFFWNSSTYFLNFVRLQVMSWALGATSRIASV
jgi:hypothetical protein